MRSLLCPNGSSARFQAGLADDARPRELAGACTVGGLPRRGGCSHGVIAGDRPLPRTCRWDGRPGPVGRPISAGLHVVGERPLRPGRIQPTRRSASTGQPDDGRPVRHRGRRGVGRTLVHLRYRYALAQCRSTPAVRVPRLRAVRRRTGSVARRLAARRPRWAGPSARLPAGRCVGFRQPSAAGPRVHGTSRGVGLGVLVGAVSNQPPIPLAAPDHRCEGGHSMGARERRPVRR